MKLRYLDHALRRMRQRGVARRQVKETVEKPENVFAGRLGKKVAFKRYGDRFLKVIYGEEDKEIVVVTAYWTRRMR